MQRKTKFSSCLSICLASVLLLAVFPNSLSSASGQFIPQGPAPSLNSALGDNNNDVGSVQAIAVSPFYPNKVFYVGGCNGGIWKTIDGGLNWAPLTDFLVNQSIASLSFDPTNGAVIAGTGITSNGVLIPGSPPYPSEGRLRLGFSLRQMQGIQIGVATRKWPFHE